MRMPESLSSLVDEGIIDEVLRPLMSGKEAQIYLVEAAGQKYVAKIYKEAQNRTFKHRTSYTEGRKVRNSRDQRAMNKRSKHGREQDEEAWRATEVDMIYRLQAAGVRVPVPYQYIDGVLIMELVVGPEGLPAPRLGDIQFTAEQAVEIYHRLLQETVRMLCAGVVHGDLSDFNVLLGVDGPVIIDFPQAIDPSKNQNARQLLLRDVENLHRFVARFAGSERRKPYAEEMWKLYESNRLTPETKLVGNYRGSQKRTDTGALLEFIGEVNADEQRRRGVVSSRGSRGVSRGASSRAPDGVPIAPKPDVELSSSAGATSIGATPGIRPRRVEVIINSGDSGGARPAGRRRTSSNGSSGRSGAGRGNGASGTGTGSRGNQARSQQGGQQAGSGQRRRAGRGQGGGQPLLRMAPQGIGHTPRVQSSESDAPNLRMLPAEGAVLAVGPAKKRRRRRRRSNGGPETTSSAGEVSTDGNLRKAPVQTRPQPHNPSSAQSLSPAQSPSPPRSPATLQAGAEATGVGVASEQSAGEPQRRRRRRRPRAPKLDEN